MIMSAVTPLTRRLGAGAVCLLALACGRVGVSLLPDEHELDAHKGFDPDAQSEDLDASPADADVEWMVPDAMEEAPPIPSPDAASSPDAEPSMDSGALPDAASSTDADAAVADATVADAGTDASAADASLPACAGARVRSLCWYFGSLNNSCLQVCSSRGGYDSRMVGLVGTTTQGGKVEVCNEVLAALGLNGTATAARRTDDKGYGCHQWGADLWWIDSAPDFRPDVAGTSARVACACLR
jgi:hypothetical protein